MKFAKYAYLCGYIVSKAESLFTLNNYYDDTPRLVLLDFAHTLNKDTWQIFNIVPQ